MNDEDTENDECTENDDPPLLMSYGIPHWAEEVRLAEEEARLAEERVARHQKNIVKHYLLARSGMRYKYNVKDALIEINHIYSFDIPNILRLVIIYLDLRNYEEVTSHPCP